MAHEFPKSDPNRDITIGAQDPIEAREAFETYHDLIAAAKQNFNRSLLIGTYKPRIPQHWRQTNQFFLLLYVPMNAVNNSHHLVHKYLWIDLHGRANKDSITQLGYNIKKVHLIDDNFNIDESSIGSLAKENPGEDLIRGRNRQMSSLLYSVQVRKY